MLFVCVLQKIARPCSTAIMCTCHWKIGSKHVQSDNGTRMTVETTTTTTTLAALHIVSLFAVFCCYSCTACIKPNPLPPQPKPNTHSHAKMLHFRYGSAFIHCSKILRNRIDKQNITLCLHSVRTRLARLASASLDASFCVHINMEHNNIVHYAHFLRKYETKKK